MTTILKDGSLRERPAVRENAFRKLDGEREYQNDGQGNAKPHADSQRPNGALSPGECLLCIEEIAAAARAAWYKPDGAVAMAPFIRKIGGVAVQFMENYETPPREGYEPLALVSLDTAGRPRDGVGRG
jgi:hypothetical protein